MSQDYENPEVIKMNSALTAQQVKAACRTYGIKNFSNLPKWDAVVRLVKAGVTLERIQDDLARARQNSQDAPAAR